MLSEKDREYIERLKLKRNAELPPQKKISELELLRKEQNRWAYAMPIGAGLLMLNLASIFRKDRLDFWFYASISAVMVVALIFYIIFYKRADRCRAALTDELVDAGTKTLK